MRGKADGFFGAKGREYLIGLSLACMKNTAKYTSCQVVRLFADCSEEGNRQGESLHTGTCSPRGRNTAILHSENQLEDLEVRHI